MESEIYMTSIKLKLTCINTGVRRISVIMIIGQGHKTFVVKTVSRVKLSSVHRNFRHLVPRATYIVLDGKKTSQTRLVQHNFKRFIM